jgi:arylsulfatase
MYVDTQKTENVILLTIDSLRADHLSCQGYDKATTPELDDFADLGVRFENAFATSSHTRESMPSLLSGRYPDAAVDEKSNLGVTSIAELVPNHTTAGFHSNPYLSRAFGFNAGFDAFDDDLHFGDWKIAMYLRRLWDRLRNRFYARVDTINARALKWLALQDSPVFLWNHYMDPHDPYEPPIEYRDKYRKLSQDDIRNLHKRAASDPNSISQDEKGKLIDLYNGEIQFTDAQIGMFLKELKSEGWLDDTLVIITADHGDAFGEHGYFGHPRHLDEELVKVPLIVVGPGFKKGKTVDTPVSTLDIVPTILQNCQLDSEEFPGTPLQEICKDKVEDRHIFCQVSGEADNKHIRKYAVWGNKSSCFCDYDREKKEIEFNNCTKSELRRKLEEHIEGRTSEEANIAEEGDEIDDEIKRRLTALGYK